MTLREKQAEFWFMVSRVILFAYSRGTRITILEWMRDLERQRLLVARGASKTILSKHLDGLAVDFVFLDDLLDDREINYDLEKYRPIGEFWESLGGVWGGRFGETATSLGWDCGHLEYKEDS